MDAFATSWPLSRLARPPAFGPFPYDAGAPMMHTNPFSFGFDIALPDTSVAFPDADPAHTPHGNPFGFGFDPISGVHALTSNPFSYGFGFAHPPDPPVTGYYADQHSSGFGFGFAQHSSEANTYTGPTDLNHYAFPTVPAPDSPRMPVYGNPFNANDVTTLSMHVPAPWESDLYNSHIQPPINEPESPQLIPTSTAPVCDDGSTAQLCASYGDDIEATLRAQEDDVEARPSPNYLDNTQGGRMSPEMRSRDLVCWMIGICQRYDLGAGTLHRAVSYVDKFLTFRPLADVDTYQLNLLGAAAVFAAAKYEDQGTRHKLGAREIAKYGEFATAQEVVDMERELLTGLGYRLGGPTAHTFVEHFFFTRGHNNHVEGDDVETEELRVRAHGLADVSLLHYGCLELKPSAVAAAAMFLARVTLKPSYGEMKKWNKELTGYKPKDLERGVDAIRSLIPKDDGNGNGLDIDIFPVFYADPD